MLVGREGIEPPQSKTADLQSAPVSALRDRVLPNASVHRDLPEPQFSRRVSSPFCSARSGRLTVPYSLHFLERIVVGLGGIDL